MHNCLLLNAFTLPIHPLSCFFITHRHDTLTWAVLCCAVLSWSQTFYYFSTFLRSISPTAIHAHSSVIYSFFIFFGFILLFMFGVYDWFFQNLNLYFFLENAMYVRDINISHLHLTTYKNLASKPICTCITAFAIFNLPQIWCLDKVLKLKVHYKYTNSNFKADILGGIVTNFEHTS